jgi:hypothetical protein
MGFLSLIPFRDWLYIGAIVALIAGGVWYTAHERAIGRAQIEQADLAAKGVLDAQVHADEQIAQKKADEAAGDRRVLQARIDSAIAARPMRPVWLCSANPGGAGLPQTSGVGSSPVSSGPGPDAVPAMSERDIGPDLSTLVRAAATVDGLYRERQQVR